MFYCWQSIRSISYVCVQISWPQISTFAVPSSVLPFFHPSCASPSPPLAWFWLPGFVDLFVYDLPFQYRFQCFPSFPRQGRAHPACYRGIFILQRASIFNPLPHPTEPMLHLIVLRSYVAGRSARKRVDVTFEMEMIRASSGRNQKITQHIRPPLSEHFRSECHVP